MIEQIDWFSREFSFDLPLWMYPNIIERLRGTPARLKDRTSSLSKELLTHQDSDTWSIQENVGHLLDLEELWLGRIEDFRAAEDAFRPADVTNTKTHEAKHNAANLAAILTEFFAERAKLVQAFESFSEQEILHPLLHPRLKTEMRLLDLAFFVAEHDDHHLAQITAIMNRFGE